MQETEARVAVRPATIEGQAEKSIEVGARVTCSRQEYTQLQRESDQCESGCCYTIQTRSQARSMHHFCLLVLQPSYWYAKHMLLCLCPVSV